MYSVYCSIPYRTIFSGCKEPATLGMPRYYNSHNMQHIKQIILHLCQPIFLFLVHLDFLFIILSLFIFTSGLIMCRKLGEKSKTIFNGKFSSKIQNCRDDFNLCICCTCIQYVHWVLFWIISQFFAVFANPSWKVKWHHANSILFQVLLK